MSQLKTYLRTQGNIEDQAKTYVEVFQGKIVKKTAYNITSDTETWTFANLKIFNDITILITQYQSSLPAFGYNSDLIVRLDDNETFQKVYQTLLNHSSFELSYDIHFYPFGGGIYLTKFFDKWGYGWILEVKKDLE